MKTKYAVLTGVGMTLAMVSACGDHKTASMPPASTTQSLDTMQVLAQARATSESSSPFEVNAGSLVLTDTSDTSDAVEINQM